jgi:HNH endonuclease
MPQCIFCLRDYETLTDEHIFPAALGGNIVVRESACVGCNNGFSKFEQPLAAELTPIRFLLRIPNRYGEIPQVGATVKMRDKEHPAKIRGDGTIRMKPTVTETIGPDGVTVYEHHYVTERQKKKLRERAKEKGYHLVESGPGNPEQAEVHFGGGLELIGSSEGFRTASKIAYVGLAFRAGPLIAKGDSFREIRAYVRDGRGNPTARLFVNERFLAACQQGPHQHSLIIAGRHDTARVDAIVRLFGGLCYFVVLSDHYGGVDFCDTLIYDAYRGDVDGNLVAHEQAEILQIEDVAMGGWTLWDDLPAAGKRLIDFFEHQIQAKRERDRAASFVENARYD